MISEESFPNENQDALFHLHVNNSGHHTSISDRSSSSLLVHEENNSSGQSSSGISSRDKSSDESKENSGAGSSQISKKSPKIENSISMSYQDIHSAYTKKRYQHVKSKVAEYIASIKEQDRISRKKRKMQRHRSLPETLGMGTYTQMMSPVIDKDKLTNCDSCSDLFKIKESEVEELKNFNEYLQTNLQQKIQQSFMLRRDAENMQFELMQLKEKEKTLCRKNSLSSFSFMMESQPKITINSGTQTEDRLISPEKNVALILPNLLGYQKDDWSPHILRQRSNSSSRTPRKPDLVEESVEVEDSNNNLLVYNLSSDDESTGVEGRKRKRSKGLKTFKNKLAWVFGSCTSCNYNAGHESAMEEYSYTQVPLIERSNIL